MTTRDDAIPDEYAHLVRGSDTPLQSLDTSKLRPDAIRQNANYAYRKMLDFLVQIRPWVQSSYLPLLQMQLEAVREPMRTNPAAIERSVLQLAHDVATYASERIPMHHIPEPQKSQVRETVEAIRGIVEILDAESRLA